MLITEVAFVQEKLVRKLMVPDEDAAKREKIVSLLTSAGKKLQSAVLSTLALKVTWSSLRGMVIHLLIDLGSVFRFVQARVIDFLRPVLRLTALMSAKLIALLLGA